MSNHDDGGPAFPGVHYTDDEGQEFNSYGGMSLWDYFAGQALQQVINPYSPETAAAEAADYADAMIAERAKRMEEGTQ